MPGVRVSGHTAQRSDSAVGCVCGWTAAAATKRAQRISYAAHLAAVRDARLAACRDCGERKTPDRMSKAKPGLCKSCSTARTRAWAEAHPTEWERHRRRSWLKRKYGITVKQYDELLAAQGGVCPICGTPPADPRGYRMHVDHCHSTGRIRGILCGPCNQGLGNLGDDPARLLAAVEYLRR